jgi:DNA topoisomerase-1
MTAKLPSSHCTIREWMFDGGAVNAGAISTERRVTAVDPLQMQQSRNVDTRFGCSACEAKGGTILGTRRRANLLAVGNPSAREWNLAALDQASRRKDTATREPDPAALAAALDPVAAAKLAKLRHVSDEMPGITRHKAHNGFDYRLPDGELVRDLETLKRIRSLAIPPAWTGVWICLHPNGHLQATGRDKRGRKQYRYHPRWREVRDESKYGKMLIFGRVLPRIRERVEADLRRRGLPRERVLAAVVRLMEVTLFRIGNDEYAKANKSYGLTTLRDRHVAIDGSHIHLNFRGKSGIRHETDITDRRLARIIKDCRDLPGYELFQYLDEDGNRHTVDSADVNDYLREISGEEITAKDFRTWAATNLAALALQEFELFDTEAKKKRAVVRAVEKVAKHLGNTPAICRRCYIHPAIFDGYLDGTLLTTLAERTQAYLAENVTGLSPEEAAVAAFLRLRLGELGKELRDEGRSKPARRSDREGHGKSPPLLHNQLN